MGDDHIEVAGFGDWEERNEWKETIQNKIQAEIDKTAKKLTKKSTTTNKAAPPLDCGRAVPASAQQARA